ncbi:hypothetical protein JCM18899A_24850 [Nocardioides sp. AN3]
MPSPRRPRFATGGSVADGAGSDRGSGHGGGPDAGAREASPEEPDEVEDINADEEEIIASGCPGGRDRIQVEPHHPSSLAAGRRPPSVRGMR